MLCLLLGLMFDPLKLLLAHEMLDGGLRLTETDTHTLGGESSAGPLHLTHSDGGISSSRLTRDDYQAIYEAADDLLQVGRTFRNTEMLIVPSDTITNAMKNYSDFSDGEYFVRFCADHAQVDNQGYCPPGDATGTSWEGESLDIRNQLRDAMQGFAVLLTAPAAVTLTVQPSGDVIPIQKVGRQGVLAAAREIAYEHLIFGNEFLIDATDTRFSVGAPPDAETVLRQEIHTLEQALQQFNLAMDMASYAFTIPLAGDVREIWFGDETVGEYFTNDEFELFGVASKRIATTLTAMADRYRKLDEPAQAQALYDQVYLTQYLHTQALAQMAQQVGAEHLINGSWDIYNNMAEARNRAQESRSEMDAFGFATDYVPLQSYTALREMVIGPDGTAGLLGTAHDLETQARDATRDFDADQDAIIAELEGLVDDYDDALFELCGEDPERPGSNAPSLTTCVGGLVAQNWRDIYAADKSAGLAYLRAANIAKQIKIEEERADNVIEVTLGLGKTASAATLAIGALEAFKTTGSTMNSSETQMSVGLQQTNRAYAIAEVGFDSELTNWLTAGAKAEAKVGVEVAVEANIGLQETRAIATQTGVEWDDSVMPVAEINSAMAYKEAIANADIEGANSAATIKNLLLQQSELLIEVEIALEELNKLLAEHNQLSSTFSRLLNQRAVAEKGIIQANAHIHNPAYRVMEDALTAQARRAFDLAVQFAYLTAKAVEYDLVSPYSDIATIYMARSTNDVYEFMNQLHAYYQAQIIEINPYARTLSIAKDILGLTDQNLDPLGQMTQEERDALRYAGFQKFLRDNVDDEGNVEFHFATSLDYRRSTTQYLFSPHIWGNRIAGVGSPLPTSQGVAINIRTQQVSDVGIPEIRLTHGGQASYRNPVGTPIYYDPGPAMPVGYSLPDGLNPANISIVARPGINGNNIIHYAGLENLSVAASKWTLGIPFNSRGNLDLALIEDIEILIDSTGRAIQSRQAQALDDARRLQAGLDLAPVDEDFRPAPARHYLPSASNTPLALTALETISNTYRGTVLITSPMEIGVQVLPIQLTESNGMLSGTVVAADAPLHTTPVALSGHKTGDAFTLTSETVTTTIAGRQVQQSFKLEGTFSHRNDMLTAQYTSVITNYIANPIVVEGRFSGSRTLSASGGMSVDADPWAIAVGETTTVTTRLLFSKYPISETRYITLTSDMGTFSPDVVELVDDLATTTFTAGVVAGRATITAANPLITATNTIEILSLGTPTSLHVQAASNPMLVSTSTTITATLRDAVGQTVQSSDRITFTASAGVITPMAVDAVNGVAVATFTAGDMTGLAHITATNGSLVGTTALSIQESLDMNYVYLSLVMRSP